MTVKRQAKIDFSNECECLVDYSDVRARIYENPEPLEDEE